MNRTLRRPMFRTGGSAEGITSGLDNPQLTASRPAYNRGRVVNPGGYKGEEEEYARMKKILDSVRGEQRPQWPQFLTSMGLDLLTRPKSGNIFQQVAASAKDPYAQMMATRSARGISEDKLSSALLGDVMDIQVKKELQTEKLASEVEQAQIKAEGEKQFDIGQAAKIAKLRDDMYQKRLDLNTEKSEIEATPELDRTEAQIDRLKRIIGSLLPATEANIADLDDVQSFLEKLEAMSPGMQDNFDDLVGEYIDGGMTLAEAYIQAKKDFEEMLSKKAEGGRIGYQNAGAVMPNTIPRAMPAVMPGPGPTDQGQDDTVQDLSFEELRARLPQEITNDIVKLLSESKQALVDFANIRTQQDVNEFNQKYDVNLVVPQEV